MTIAAIVLGVLALAAIFVVEWLKKPRFKIMLLEPSTTPPPGKCRFLRLAVRNLDLPKLITKFVNRNTGDSCAAELVIYDKDGRRLKSSPVIWWPRQVVKIAVTPDKRVIDTERIPPSQLVRRDIPAGQQAILTLALKFEGDPAFSIAGAWTLQGERAQGDIMTDEYYKVNVKVSSGNISSSKFFLIENRGTDVDSFILKEYLHKES